MLTGWGDDWYDDGEDDDTENEPSVGTDGDVLGDVTASVRKRLKSSLNREGDWELDPADFVPGQVTTPPLAAVWGSNNCLSPVAFRIPTTRPTALRLGKRHLVVQSGSDRSVATLRLTPCPSSAPFQVVSASSDGTLKAWNPHEPSSDPTLVGSHSDYVRCLGHWYSLSKPRPCLTMLTPLV